MKLVYIAGPYRAKSAHGIVENIRRAEEYAKKYIQLGYAVLCPHKNFGLLDGIIDDSKIMDACLTILGKCDICVMMPNWRESVGATIEEQFSRTNKIELIYE